ncbi:MAG TPA: sugar phosphate isomerase/epimerase family protein [Rhizomicrobium sp.]|nr:sugar phosphate isomerase/epimerase family protein [Rhizomicrobium sp.]
MSEIGFMQGRLSPRVEGKIQAFPWDRWRDEFPIAEELGFRLMEWTLDHDRLAENPLMTAQGQAEIGALSQKHGVSVVSLTGDIFMQMPFWRVTGAERTRRLAEFEAVADACAKIGIKFIVVPLVDNGAMTSPDEEDAVIAEFGKRADWLKERGLAVVFECDYPAEKLAAFIDRFPQGVFGINYDIGNSAALGYDSAEEIAAYFPRILNVHIKDRKFGGTTVPLGTGNADLPATIDRLVKRGYRGFYILQTARAEDEGHATVLAKYRDMAKGWIEAA